MSTPGAGRKENSLPASASHPCTLMRQTRLPHFRVNENCVCLFLSQAALHGVLKTKRCWEPIQSHLGHDTASTQTLVIGLKSSHTYPHQAGYCRDACQCCVWHLEVSMVSNWAIHVFKRCPQWEMYATNICIMTTLKYMQAWQTTRVEFQKHHTDREQSSTIVTAMGGRGSKSEVG